MSESTKEPTGDRSGIADATGTTLRQPTFFRVLLVLAATVVVLVGMRLAAPVLNPVLFAVVFSLLFSPVYAWLKRRRIPTPLALVIMLVGLTILFVVTFYILAASIYRLSVGIGFYTAELNEQLASMQGLVDLLGFSSVQIRDVVQPRAVTGAVVFVLAGIASFLRNLFLILAIMLFLLAEGPAIMNRLRATAGTDHPQVKRLTVVGQSVVRQFGLRAIVNLATGAGVFILLFPLGVDFPLMWGILTFFLAFVPYIGIAVATVPPALLALAEFGPSWAILVVIGIQVINVLAENVLSPMMMSRGLSISPTIVFLSFVLWTWLLGAPGAFLAVPITLFVAVMFDSFPETRWLANVVGISGPDPGAPTPDAEVKPTG